MEREDTIMKWDKRFDADRFYYPGELRVNLARVIVTDWVGLTPDEANIFLDPNLPRGMDLEKVTEYTRVEQKVGDMVEGGQGLSKEEFDERHKTFIEGFKRVMESFYSPSELEEIASLSQGGDALYFALKISGPSHWTTRKIRNSYLPRITSFIVYDPVNGGEDLTHTLFDGEKDPIDQIDELLGG